MRNGKDILEGVLQEFAPIAQIPRPSGHEKAVSDYLCQRLRELGLNVVQDEKWNIIAEQAASKGLEEAPRTILQSHMDMVCVAEDGVKYDPLRDSIHLRRDEEFLEAEGTSLGSDDGIGIAGILYVLQHSTVHGPLRVIFTVDEEQGMSGAIHLDAVHLRDAAYLINCDSEEYDVLTVGSAGSVNLDFSRKLSWQKPEKGNTWLLTVRGLHGGHSGERIGDGRGNAIRTLALCLQALSRRGIDFELASLQGGKARNAIPADAQAVIVTDADGESVRAVLAEEKKAFLQIYEAADPDAELLAEKKELPRQVFSSEDTTALLRLLTVMHTGVFAMSQVIPGLIETSANLGVIRTDAEKISFQYFPRSAVDARLDEFRYMAEAAAALSGFELHIGTQSSGWKERGDSRLAKIMTEVFSAQNGRPMKVETIHAGLECGWYFKKNPQLDMVSIGVTTKDIHSPMERLVLPTVAPQNELILGVLEKIAE